MTDIPDLPPVLERLLEGGEHDAVGAYALDALPSAERTAFEAHLAQCAQCQSELVLLQQSADVLRRALVPNGVVQGSGAAVTTAPPPAPVPEPADSEVTAEEMAATTGEPVIEDATVPTDAPSVEEEPVPAEAPSFDAPPLPEAEMPAELAAVAPAIDDETVEIIGPVLPESEPKAEPVAEEPAAKPPRKTRPRGRVAPGVQPPPEAIAAAEPARRSRLPWIIAGLGLAAGIVAILAALSLAEMKGNLEDEIDFQNAQIAELNAQRDLYLQQTTAVTWTLAPTTIGAPDSTAVVYASPAGTSAVLSVTGMSPLESGQVYQVWYLPPEGADAPVAGPTFSVDDTGAAVLQIAPDLSPYEALAITIEPEGGSEEATSNPVIQGFVSVQ